MPTYRYCPSDPNSIELIEYDDGVMLLSVNSIVEKELFEETMDLSEGDLVPGIILKPLIISELIQTSDDSYLNWADLAERVRPSGDLDRSSGNKVKDLLESCNLEEEQVVALATLAVETEWGEFITPDILGYDESEWDIAELSQLTQ